MTIMRPLTCVLIALGCLGLVLVAPVSAGALEMDGCAHDPTLDALRACVVHATEQGHIDNAGVARALLAKIDAAERAVEAGDVNRAVAGVSAFVTLVEAQSGTHVAAEHADHL